METTLEYNDYVEDYEEFIELDSLDHRTVTVEPGASIRINDAIRVWVSVVATDLDYDERPALDADGGEAIGTTRNYRYYQLRTSLRVRLNQKSNLVFGVRGADRQDTYQGFYDYRSSTLSSPSIVKPVVEDRSVSMRPCRIATTTTRPYPETSKERSAEAKRTD